MTISRCWETAAGFSQDVSSLSPGPHHPLLYDSGPSPLIHRTCLDPGAIWVQDPEARWLLRPLLFPSSVYEHLSHKFSAHIKFWGQEPFFFFFMNKEGVKPPTKQTRFPFQQVPHWASWESLGMFSISFCFFLTLGNRVRLDFVKPWCVRTRE